MNDSEPHEIELTPELLDYAYGVAKEIREWAKERFARLEDLATRTEVDLADRQLVESLVQRNGMVNARR